MLVRATSLAEFDAAFQLDLPSIVASDGTNSRFDNWRLYQKMKGEAHARVMFNDSRARFRC